MTVDRKTVEKELQRHLRLFGSPSVAQVEASRARIRERLRAGDKFLEDAPRTNRRLSMTWAWRRRLVIAATAVLVVLVVIAPWPHGDQLTTLEAADRWHFIPPYVVHRILAAFTKGMNETAAPLRPSSGPARAGAAAVGQADNRDFEVASIKPCDPDHLPPQPDNGRGGGVSSFQLTPGRLRALCVTASTLVRVAYGYGPLAQDFNTSVGPRTMTFGIVYGVGEEDGRRVRNGADWMRSERYTIEAVAREGSRPDPQALRGSMLQRLLERRLQLKAHIEVEQVPGFALTVAKGGLKIKPAAAGSCDELPARPGSPLFYGHAASVLTPPRTLADLQRGEKPSCGLWGHRNGPNQVVIGGGVPLESLSLTLGMRLGGVRVADRTGIIDRFNYVLEFVLDENTPGLGVELPDRRAELDVPPAATIFSALEEQLGLRLESARAGREFIVIDHVERPSPN